MSGVRRLRRLAVASALVLSSAVVGVATTSAGPASADPSWTTVFQDDFNGSAGSPPSSANWRYDTGTGFGTNEIETMTSSTSNVALDGNGDLAITPLRDANGNWTSGRIETNQDNFQAPAGGLLKMEARIANPDVTGAAAAGYWPAFWALGTPLRNGGQWPDVGEFDAMEDVNGQNLVYGTLHCGVSPGGPCNEPDGRGGNVACPGSQCSGNFHTYTFELDNSVSPAQMRWYVDGQQYWSVSASDVDANTWNDATNHGIYLILDLAMGGDFPNGVAGGATPTAATDPGHPMLVDYVQVQTAPGGSGSTGSGGSSGGTNRIVGLASKCIDVPSGNGADGQPLDLWTCNGTGAQNWTFGSDGTIRDYGLCLDDAGASTSDGTNIQIANCNGSAAQVWTLTGSGELVNQLSGKCVDVQDSNTADGARLQQWACAGTPNQTWSRQ